MVYLLGMDDKNNIALRRIDIGILEQKDPVYAVLLQHGELDEKPDWTSQILAYDKILLTADLNCFSLSTRRLKEIRCLTHAFKEIQQIPTRLVPEMVCIRPGMESHGRQCRQAAEKIRKETAEVERRRRRSDVDRAV